MKPLLVLIFALVALTACGTTSSQRISLNGPTSSTVSSATTMPSTATPSASSSQTVEPMPVRHEAYPYHGEHGARIDVMCDQTYQGGTFTYTVATQNLGAGTFRMGAYGQGDLIQIGDDGSVDNDKPSVPNVNVDTIVTVTIAATNYTNVLRFRGCEPF